MTPDRQRRATNVLSIALIGFVLFWMAVVEPAIRESVEAQIGKPIFSLPTPIALTYFVMIGALPGLILGLIVFAAIYAIWYVPQRKRLVREQLTRLKEARLSLESALLQIEEFERELEQKADQVERMRMEAEALKSVNAEGVRELEMKFRAMESLAKHRRWTELTIAFVMGVISSLVATYIYEAAKRIAP